MLFPVTLSDPYLLQTSPCCNSIVELDVIIHMVFRDSLVLIFSQLLQLFTCILWTCEVLIDENEWMNELMNISKNFNIGMGTVICIIDN